MAGRLFIILAALVLGLTMIFGGLYGPLSRLHQPGECTASYLLDDWELAVELISRREL